jgi:hypothetical protein
MVKRGLILAGWSILLAAAASADLGSLSQLYLLGKGLLDTDGDGLADRVALTIVIPDNPTPTELALASDIAARANFESLAQSFSLVKRESEVGNVEKAENPVLIGTNVKWLREAVKDGNVVLPALAATQGYVGTFIAKTQSGLFVAAGSEDALLQTGRAFFLRWPYFWDIWGREEGATFETLERDITQYLNAEGIPLRRTIVRSVLYEFPNLKKSPGALKKISFSAGEVKDLGVDIYFTDEEDLQKAARAFEALRVLHARGQRSEIFTYAGCGQVSLSLKFGKTSILSALPRLGLPKRMLTPSFKDPPRADGAGKEFDLLSLLSTKGVYGDLDRDGIFDAVETRIVVPQTGLVRGVAQLASKLVLHTAGASFPLLALDREVEFPKALVAPILIGPNTLTQELERVGKLALPPLENAAGLIRAVPRAFNKSSALVVAAADAAGLEKTLNYLSLTFPYFDAYGDGHPKLDDAAADFERFLKGEKGAGEAYFAAELRKHLDDFKDRDLERFKAEFVLPQKNTPFEDEVRKTLAAALKVSPEVQTTAMTEAKRMFAKDRAFSWEADDALALIREKLPSLDHTLEPIRLSLGLSESPEVRLRLKKEVESYLQTLKAENVEVEVLSAYKQGFFWLLEKVLPALKGKPVAQLMIQFAEEPENLGQAKRFYAEPSRWLQELYPIDEILAKELALPLDKILFEMVPAGGPVYQALALDAKNARLFEQAFSPRLREIPYLKLFPEWGNVRVTTGWVKIEKSGAVLVDVPLQTDLERLWAFYQDEALAPLYAQIQKKTGNAPTFSKQPYFKQLRVEVWASEPDYRLGLDEEIVSSLEALHDEVYFDTLDLLRGITEIEPEAEAPEDTSRFSAPGNVFPVVHPSTEGGPPRITVTAEDWLARAPEMTLTWKERDRDEATRKVGFPALRPKSTSLPALVYNGLEERIDKLGFEVEFEKEADYLTMIGLLASYRELGDKGALVSALSFPKLDGLVFALKCKEMSKEERVSVAAPAAVPAEPMAASPRPAGSIVDTAKIMSPEMVQDAVRLLSAFPVLRTYIGGVSYERRSVPVIEAFTPLGPYVSIPRLIAHKPTLYLSGRQHANEVSSTNYILKLAELLATDKAVGEFVRRMNFVLHPMENPDGAALAYDLQNLTPFHSLHAGRYSALGLEIGTMTGASRPLLPEAAVKRDLNAKWFPDISLNLHGYPSHEWVQSFSGYSPYLFRDYWIPKGWFAYVRGLTLPIYERFKAAGEEVRSFIIAEMNADPKIKESNKKFYDRYFRWATRWQPHLRVLELYEGVNLYAKRRGSSENRLSARGQTTYLEETPELMDETARGAWLDFLSTQGLAYLRAHMNYLTQTKFEIVRVEEESQDRVRLQFLRGRPGTTKK